MAVADTTTHAALFRTGFQCIYLYEDRAAHSDNAFDFRVK